MSGSGGKDSEPGKALNVNDNPNNSKNPKSFQARLERGLKSLSTKTAAYRKAKIKSGSSGKSMDSGLTNVDVKLYGTGGNAGVKKNNVTKIISGTCCEEDMADKMRMKTSTKSMKQLFSKAASWSSDSVASHSESCTCCAANDNATNEKRQQPPCPVHGASCSFDKK